jgi:hypothetical protein
LIGPPLLSSGAARFIEELGQTDGMPVIVVDLRADTPRHQLVPLIQQAVIAQLPNNELVTRWPEHYTGNLLKGTNMTRYEVSVETQTLGGAPE